MAVTAWSGPLIAFGTPASSQPPEYNESRGPSLTDCGEGFIDPRAAYGYNPGYPTNRSVLGFYNNYASIDILLSSGSTNALVTSSAQTPTAGTALTITPSTAKDTKATTIVAPENGATVSVTCIGSTTAALTYGSAGTIAMWNPGTVARNIIIYTSSNLDAGGYSVAGRDLYGFKVTETILSSVGGATGTASVKAYKYISSIVASTTVTSTGVGVGLGNSIGFPLFVGTNGLYVQVANVSTTSSNTVLNNLSSVTLIPGSTATATATTNDVRGLWASTATPNATVRYQAIVTPGALQMQSVSNGDYTALFGVAQFSSV